MGAEIRWSASVSGARTRSDRAVRPVVDSELTDGTEESGGFRVRLRNFEGPFDLLLTLISQRRLDVTEVALHQVTDDFIAYTRALSADLDARTTGAGNVLDQITEFLVVAATLLDLKAAKLLPAGEVEDAEDLALLEARDLLFARLLQYRAFKQIAQLFAELESAALRRYPRAVALEERYVGLLPEVLLGVDAAAFADIAAAALAPRPVPTVGLDHLHASPVSVPEQAAIILDLLRQRGEGAWAGFGDLVAGCEETVQIVARFLALLELYRQRAVAFEQLEPLGDLLVSWTGEGGDDGRMLVSSEDYG
jgi:segregation and condensation protein A